MSTAAILQAFSELHPAQQIQLVEDMWDKVALSSEGLKLSAPQKRTLRARKKKHAGKAPVGRTWQEVRQSLLSSDAR